MTDTTISEHDSQQTQPVYLLPTDRSSEYTRLDTQAAVLTELIGGSPFLGLPYVKSEVRKVVDIGCGSGIATSQLGQVFPSARVFGLDIVPVPETTKNLAPSNVSWVMGNVLEVNHDEISANSSDNVVMNREVFAKGGLDYVFARMLLAGINDWSRYYSTVAASMKSGAIVEHQDTNLAWYRVGSSERISDDWEWYRITSSAWKSAGFEVNTGLNAAQMMERAGLEVLKTQTFDWACTASDKIPGSENMARYYRDDFLPVWPFLMAKSLSKSGYKAEDIERLTQDSVRDILSEEGIHQKYTVVVARKP